MALVDLVKIKVTSVGAAPLSLGGAVQGFRGREALTNGATYSYSIQQNGNYEVGRGTYLSSSGTLTRTPTASSNGNAPIILTGSAEVAFVAAAVDLLQVAGDVGAFIALLGSPEGLSFIGTLEPGVNAQALIDSKADQDDIDALYVAIDAKLTAATLAANTGAGLVGYSPTLTYAAGTVGAKLIKSPPVNYPAAAITDGTTDTVAALLAADALGPVTLPAGLYKINSSLTLANRLTVTPGAAIVFAAGVSLTVPAIEAGDYQIFNLNSTNAVIGLAESRVAWFAGALVNVTSNADIKIQKAYDAVVSGGTVHWPAGALYSNGTGINVTKAQRTLGRGKKISKLRFLTTAANGLLHANAEGSSVEQLGFDMAASGTIPTSGKAIAFDFCYNVSVSDCFMSHPFIGIGVANTNGFKQTDTDINDALSIVQFIAASPNVELSGCNAAAFSEFVDLSTTAGFIAGEGLTWPGGTGAYGYTTSTAGRAKIIVNDSPPAVGNTMTGVTSGASATMSAIFEPHHEGALRLENNAAAFAAVNCAWAGGKVSCYMNAPSNTHGIRPEYGVFTNCYFDHASDGLQMVYGVGFQFVNCWFSSRFGIGAAVINVQNVSFTNCMFDSSWKHGLQINTAASGVTVSGGYAAGNNRVGGVFDGVNVQAGCNNFTITGGFRSGGTTVPGFSGTQRYGIRIDAGASTNYVVSNTNTTGNGTGGISDLGTGTKAFASNL